MDNRNAFSAAVEQLKQALAAYADANQGLMRTLAAQREVLQRVHGAQGTIAGALGSEVMSGLA